MFLRDVAVVDLDRDPATKKLRRTEDGYLPVFARVARTGIQTYKGKEIGRPDLGDVKVYRPPEQVFSRDAMKSFAHRPVTLNHPGQTVTAKNWRKYAVGQTGEDVVRDGEYIRVPMMIMAQHAIDAYENDKVDQLSMGYSVDLCFEDGVTPDGDRYDAVQRQIRGNHLAMVPVARGGDKLRIGDRTPIVENVKAKPIYETSWIGDRDKIPDECPECGAAVVSDDDECAQCGHSFVKDGQMDWIDDSQFYWLTDKEFSTERRKQLTKTGAAMPGGRFPIESVGDLENAVRDYNRIGQPADVKAHIISRARAIGATSRLPDGWVSSAKDSFHEEKGMKTIDVGGIPVTLEDIGAAAVQNHISRLHGVAQDLQGKLDKEAADREENEEEKTRAMDGFKKQIEAKDGEIAVLKKQVEDSKLTPEKLDLLVKDRAAVVEKAKKLLGDKFVADGKEVGDIKRAAVSAKLTDAVAKEMSDDAIEGAFKALTVEAKKSGTDALKDAIHRSGQLRIQNDSGDNPRAVADSAYEEMVKRQTEAWKYPPAYAATAEKH